MRDSIESPYFLGGAGSLHFHFTVDGSVMCHRPTGVRAVFVTFDTTRDAVPEMIIRVRDQGLGFDPDNIADPLAPENILKGSGRGIFLIRNFMDDVQLRRVPEGGMEIQMVKRAQPATAEGNVSA